MSVKGLRDLSSQELVAREAELRQELFNLRFQHATRQLENTARLSQARREMARVLTLLRERELADAR